MTWPRSEEEAAAGKAPEPSDEMATRLAKLAAGVDEAAERRAAKRLECRRVRDRAVWPTRVRDSDADRECRTVLKQLRKLAVKKHSFYFEKMARFPCRNLFRKLRVDGVLVRSAPPHAVDVTVTIHARRSAACPTMRPSSRDRHVWKGSNSA